MERNELLEAVSWLELEIRKLEDMSEYFPTVQACEIRQAVTYLYMAHATLSDELYEKQKGEEMKEEEVKK